MCANPARIADALGGVQPGIKEFHLRTGLCDEKAILSYNLAPFELRRDIAALGLLHKFQLGEAHADFDGLFPKALEAAPAQTRLGARRHCRQL